MEILRPIEVPFAPGQVDNRQILSLKKKNSDRLSLTYFFFPFLSRSKLSRGCLQSFLPVSLSPFCDPTWPWPRTATYTSCEQPGYQSSLVLFLLKGLTPRGPEKRENGGLGTSA